MRPASRPLKLGKIKHDDDDDDEGQLRWLSWKWMDLEK
jgi:hypothetical protein